MRVPLIDGVILTYPEVHRDERGTFSCAGAMDVRATPSHLLLPAGTHLVRSCAARSVSGVIRGLHVRAGTGEAKLVRCTAGVIYDVVVDLREGSRTSGDWSSVVLDEYCQATLLIPAGCAHGYQVLSATADVTYLIEGDYDPGEDLALRWDDPDLGIAWPLSVTAMSERDQNAPGIAGVRKALA